MAIAGKVAITPKGEWSAEIDYTKLDLVFYRNASYVATKPSTGVNPTNETYWMLVVQSSGSADFEGIIDGTIQVGNAKTLDGHGAEYFATKEDLENIEGGGTVEGGDADTLDGHDSSYFATAESVNNIIDGTTQAKNAKTLDGHGIEYFATADHEQSADDITGGTFGGKVVANSTSVANLAESQVRNIYIGETDLEAGVSPLPTGDIYIKYK